jgi:hypothetical protein
MPVVIWSFNRAAAQVDIEVRRLPGYAAYELVVDYSDGSETLERFDNARKLVERTLQVQDRLRRDGWVPSRPTVARTAQRPAATAEPPSRMRAIPRALLRIQKQIARRLAASFGL